MTPSACSRQICGSIGRIVLALTALIALAGCSQQPPGALTIAAGNRNFNQTFVAAYHSQVIGGDSDIVLLDEAAEQSLDGKPCDAPVRQVMRIRVLWNANRDLKADHTSSSNATLHWYVLGNTPATANDVIEYAGTAMAVLESDGNQTICSVRGASMRMVARRGSLHDPIGKASFKGMIHASENPAKARQALEEVRDTILAEAAADDLAVHRPLADRASSMAR
jgi:hypothetical protein